MQNDEGKIKTFSTLSSELINKISKEESLYDLNSTQIIMVIINPELWKKIPLIKVQNSEILNYLGSKNNLLSFNDFFNNKDEFLLKQQLEELSRKSDDNKSKFDKDIIKIYEKIINLNYIFISGNQNILFNIFPNTDPNNLKWEGFLNIPRSYDDTIINIDLFSISTDS